jgi:uncharacterized membrane protein
LPHPPTASTGPIAATDSTPTSAALTGTSPQTRVNCATATKATPALSLLRPKMTAAPTKTSGARPKICSSDQGHASVERVVAETTTAATKTSGARPETTFCGQNDTTVQLMLTHSRPAPAAHGLTTAHQTNIAIRSAFRHWLTAVNVSLATFIAGALAAPILAALGWRSGADALYAAYRFTCHEWAFRSFFLFAPNQPPLAVYSQQQLADLGTDPFGFIGNPALGWKMAFCERDLAIYAALLGAGLYYASRRNLRPASFLVFGMLSLPMALDGFTQLFGWRESTWELRVATGVLFGLASAWLVLPRLDSAFGLQPATRRYSPDASCEPVPLPEPRPQLSPRG